MKRTTTYNLYDFDGDGMEDTNILLSSLEAAMLEEGVFYPDAMERAYAATRSAFVPFEHAFTGSIVGKTFFMEIAHDRGSCELIADLEAETIEIVRVSHPY